MAEQAAAAAATTTTAAPAATATSAAAPAPAAGSSPAATEQASAAPDRTSLVSGAKADGEAAASTEAKPADGETKPAEGEIKYEFKLPEGMKLDEAATKRLQDDAAAVFKDSKVSQEQAQALFEKHVALTQEAVSDTYQLWHDTQAAWKTEVKADKEIGGQNMDRNLGAISKLIDEFGGKEAVEIKQALDFTGAGNNPAIIRLLHRLAAAATEGDHVAGSPSGQAGKSAERTLAAMYPSSSNAAS